MKKITILFFALFLFSCCPEKKKNTQPKEEAKRNETVKVDSSRFKTIYKEKGADIPDDDLEFTGDCLEGEWGPV